MRLCNFVVISVFLSIILSFQTDKLNEHYEEYYYSSLNNINQIKDVSYTLDIDLTNGGKSSCSGTAISKNSLLTATHCLNNVLKLKLNNQEVKILNIISDTTDYTIIILDKDYFSKYKNYNFVETFEMGEEISYLGNPGQWKKQYRKGYVTGFVQNVILLDINGFNGDSGSGVFNKNGNLMGIISAGASQTNQVGQQIKLMVVYKNTFTIEQKQEYLKLKR